MFSFLFHRNFHTFIYTDLFLFFCPALYMTAAFLFLSLFYLALYIAVFIAGLFFCLRWTVKKEGNNPLFCPPLYLSAFSVFTLISLQVLYYKEDESFSFWISCFCPALYMYVYFLFGYSLFIREKEVILFFVLLYIYVLINWRISTLLRSFSAF